MKHRCLQGATFLAIGVFLLAALAWMMWDRVLTDPLLIGLVFVVVICACINILIGLLLMFGKRPA